MHLHAAGPEAQCFTCVILHKRQLFVARQRMALGDSGTVLTILRGKVPQKSSTLDTKQHRGWLDPPTFLHRSRTAYSWRKQSSPELNDRRRALAVVVAHPVRLYFDAQAKWVFGDIILGFKQGEQTHWPFCV